MTSRTPQLVAAAALALALWAGCAERRPAPLDVVLLLADDLGWSDLGVHGGPATPAIDGLFAEGLELERFYVSPLCTPTRAGLLTGRAPERYGLLRSVVRPWSDAGLDPDERTLGDVFRASGYRTGLVGKWHLGHARKALHPNRRGFAHFYGHLNGAVDYYTHTRAEGLDWQRNGEPVREPGYATDLLAAEAVRFIEADDERPYLLVLAFNAPHGPPQPPRSWTARAGEAAADPRAAHAAAVAALDAAVGQVLGAIARGGQQDRTLVVFTSDNGAGRYGSNHPLRDGKGTTFEGGIRVPAALRLPGVLAAGARSQQLLRELDLLPTLAAASGVPLPEAPAVDGTNLWPQITSGTAVPRAPFYFASQRRDASYAAVLADGWKLVSRRSEDGAARVALFDLQQDPGEQHDRSAQEPARLARLAELLERWEQGPAAVGLRREDGPPPGWRAPEDWSAAAR